MLSPDTDCTGGWVSFRVGCGGENMFCSHRGSNPEPSSPCRISITAPLASLHRIGVRGGPEMLVECERVPWPD